MPRSRFVMLSVFLDGLFVNAAIVAAFFVRFGGTPPTFNYSAYTAIWPIITLLFLGAAYIYGLYEPERTQSFTGVVRAVLQAVTLGTLLTAAVAFFAGPRFFSFSRLVIVLAWLFELVLLVTWRLVMQRVLPIRWPEQRVVIVGTGEVAVDLARELSGRAEWGYRVAGMLAKDTDAAARARTAGLPVIGLAAELAGVIAAHDVNRVIVASPMAQREAIEQIALSGDVRVEVVPELYEIFIGSIDDTVSDIPLMQITRPASPAWSRALKRLLDVVFSLAIIVVLSPLLLLAALGVLVSMGRPVFFIQERVGRDLKPFRILKFRTMVRNAERETGPVLATEGDPRITPLGRLLRHYRIDELPQLVNILAGEMSFVGPRPERPEFVERLLATVPSYAERFRIKPGATGLAQVSGSYATTAERKLKYDLIYMYHQNLLMDAQIVFETVRVVLTGRGAR